MSTYGYFNNENMEYVITEPRTPVKWTNYIGTLEFGGLVDHTGGALLCAKDPALNRITKYIPQLPDSDFKGTTLFLRFPNQDNKGYMVFSPFYTPTLHPLDLYECHVGLLYQRIVSIYQHIKTEVTIFVPPRAPVEIRDIRVTNLRSEPLKLDAIPVVEYSHFDALKQFTNADWVPQTMQCDACHEEEGLLRLEQYAFMKKGDTHNYFTANVPVDSFQTDRKIFLGANGYGGWSNPLELQNEHLSNYEARRADVISALLLRLGEIKPGETRRFITMLGQDDPENIQNVVQKYRQEKEVDKAFLERGEFWENYLSKISCQTPSESLNAMVNVHNPRQCYITFNWSRYLSLYQLGFGARGLGFRDSSQDVMGVLPSIPQEAKGLIKKLLSIQKPEGSAMHQFFPLTMEASGGDGAEDGDERPYGDDHLWIVMATCAYLKETGDYAFLEEKISYYDDNLSLVERNSESVFKHLQCALAYTKNNLGQQGLPLLGHADWNDTINLPGKAESLFIANQYGVALREMIELCQFLKNEALANEYQADYEHMKSLVNQHAWDGEWYIRYFMENGDPLGSQKNDKGQIYANAQSWAVLSGFATPQRMEQALEAVYQRLNTESGIKLSTPGYNGYIPEIGGVTTFPPGAKENGGIFLHSNPWVMIAECIRGNGDRAFQYYQQINPATKNDNLDRYECEPYCYAQNILSDEHPQFGLGRNSWLSGTASWTYQAATQYILGIRPTHEGLLIDPCIPAEWDSFTATRIFRGATYNITVKNPNHVSKGTPVKIPLLSDGKTHAVELELGVSP